MNDKYLKWMTDIDDRFLETAENWRPGQEEGKTPAGRQKGGRLMRRIAAGTAAAVIISAVLFGTAQNGNGPASLNKPSNGSVAVSAGTEEENEQPTPEGSELEAVTAEESSPAQTPAKQTQEASETGQDTMQSQGFVVVAYTSGAAESSTEAETKPEPGTEAEPEAEGKPGEEPEPGTEAEPGAVPDEQEAGATRFSDEEMLDWLDNSEYALPIEGLWWGISEEEARMILGMEPVQDSEVLPDWMTKPSDVRAKAEVLGVSTDVCLTFNGGFGLTQLRVTEAEPGVFQELTGKLCERLDEPEQTGQKGLLVWKSITFRQVPRLIYDRCLYLQAEADSANPQREAPLGAQELSYLMDSWHLVRITIDEEERSVSWNAGNASMVRRLLPEDAFAQVEPKYRRLYSCQSLTGNLTGLELEKSDLIIDEPSDTKLTAAEDGAVFSRTGSQITIETTSEEWQTFGEEYRLQIFLDGFWYDILSSRQDAWNDIAWELHAPDCAKVDRQICWGEYGGELPDGYYRIVKQVSGKNLAAAFIIGQDRFPDKRFAARVDEPVYGDRSFDPPVKGLAWGMTAEEVKKAVNDAQAGTVIVDDTVPYELLIAGEYLGFPAQIRLYFEATEAIADCYGLESATVIFADDVDTEAVNEKILSLFGEPDGEESGTPRFGEEGHTSEVYWKTEAGAFNEWLADRLCYMRHDLVSIDQAAKLPQYASYVTDGKQNWQMTKEKSLVEAHWSSEGKTLTFSGLEAAAAAAAASKDKFTEYVQAMKELSGDTSARDISQNAKSSYVPLQDDRVSLYVDSVDNEAGVITASFAVDVNLVIPETVTYNDYYYLQVNVDGYWYDLEMKYHPARIYDERRAAEGTVTTFVVNIGESYGELETGVYRIIKRVNIGGEEKQLCARFLVIN